MPQFTTKELPKSCVECMVTFDESEVAPVREAIIRKHGASVTVPGFRPGKAPIETLEQKVDPRRVMEDTVRQLLPDAIDQALNENEWKPIARPGVSVEAVDPLTVKVVFPLQPTVKLKKVKIDLKQKEPQVDDKDIDRVVESSLKQRQTVSEVNRPAQASDRVTVSFYGEGADGNEIEGTRIENREVDIGSKTLIPGFEDALIGLSAGDEKSFELTFPEKYHKEELQGAPVTFHATLHCVDEVQTPELTDAFAKEHLAVDSADMYRQVVRDSLLEQEKRAWRSSQEQQVLNAIADATDVELADVLIEEEVQGLFAQLRRQLEQQGIGFESWLAVSGKKPEDIEAEFREQAIVRLKTRFGIEKRIEDDGITASDDDINALIEERAATAPPEQADQVRQAYQLPEYRADIEWQAKVNTLISSYL